MMTTKRKLHNADGYDDGRVAKRNSLSYDTHTPWMPDARPPREWRTLGTRAVQPSLPLENMVSAVRDLIDPDFDPLIAILDDEPRFLKPLPTQIAPEDLEFLRFRGALSTPESGLRNELLRCYIKWVHSFMPVLNLQEFLRCIAQNDPNGNISLLLFQAVMFVATAFVDLKHLQDAGYATRKSARSAFYTRLRLLYSLDCEEDRIVILQTLLLMTYWTDHVNHPNRDIWDWIGVCNTQAQSIGLNRDPTSASQMDVRMKRLRTRIWWCMFARDRLIAMGLRRPTQVNEGTSNIPMLSHDDFDFEPFHPSVIDLFRCRQLEDVSHQKRLATMFIEKTKLCQCIGRVLFAQYSTSQCLFGMTNRTTITLIPRQASESELARCSQRLDSWLNSLPKDAQYIPASKNNFKDGEDVLLLHGAMVRMLYHATISALHRPWALLSNKDQTRSRLELADRARSKMQDAAIGITHIIQGLNQLNLTRFLPQSGVTVIIPAAVAHLANIMSANPAVREASLHNFQRCVQVLQGLKDIYPAADMEFANIEAAVRFQADSTSTFLKIMQYTHSTNTTHSQVPQSPSRKFSNVSTVQTLSPTEDSWNFPRDEQAQFRRPQHTNRERSHSPSQEHQYNRKKFSTASTTTNGFLSPEKEQLESTPSNSNNLNDHFNSTMPPSGSPYEDTNPFLRTDLFDFDIEPNFSLPSNNNNDNNSTPNNPLFGLDWMQDLLRDPDSNPESNPNPEPELNFNYPSSPMEDHTRDMFSFTDKQEPRSLGHNNTDITGDLDKDLGLNSGDEMFG
ncbi:transcription factor domain-containing protein [Aspergillus affinis]|uniref:transcription factor domain-containing protein n=1 Tax=Aspergillus affinis TaxID=1070780 RepID=UPI0022FEB6AA|nr:putative C6 transcription factor [Aspergillus affinis]KAI9043553.1 putative C6 transcription factor [Aspergillus affinis]